MQVSGHERNNCTVLTSQLKFETDQAYATIVQSIMRYVPVLPAEMQSQSTRPRHEEAPSSSPVHLTYSQAYSSSGFRSIAPRPASLSTAIVQRQPYEPFVDVPTDVAEVPQPQQRLVTSQQNQPVTSQQSQKQYVASQSLPEEISVKMPTPVSKQSVTHNLTHEELETRFMEFISDDKNIALVERVEAMMREAGLLR